MVTLNEVIELNKVVQFAIENAKVRWLAPNGDLIEGTARHICSDEFGNFIGNDQDVRTGILRITTTTGWDRWMPVTEAVELIREGKMAQDS